MGLVEFFHKKRQKAFAMSMTYYVMAPLNWKELFNKPAES